MTKPLSLQKCRDLISDGGADLSDDEITRMRDVLYCLADVITDIYSDLENINPDLAGTDALNPPGNLNEQWIQMAEGQE